MERLQKVLAHAGIASRRKAEELILAGRVSVDGQIVTTLGVRVDPRHQRILVDGIPIEAERKVTYLLNKPPGTLSTVHDPHGRPTVRDLLRDVPERVYPVGRLDADTSGVLLLTNDGELSYRLTHPRFGVEKVYRALVQGRITDGALRRLSEGVPLEDGMTAPAKATLVWRGDRRSLLELTLTEGRNRQVRRMTAAVGLPTLRLVRASIGAYALHDLQPGQWRPL